MATKKERIGKKCSARYCGSYSKMARWRYDLLVYGGASKIYMRWTARQYVFHRMEYDIEKKHYINKYHKQYAIIGCRLAKKIYRNKVK